MSYNRVRVHPRRVLQEGFVAVDKFGFYLFRPDRGSGGFALYSSAKKALQYGNNEDDTAKAVRLVLEEV